MIVNLSYNSTGPKRNHEMLISLAKELCREYHIPEDQFRYFLYSEGKDYFCSWMTGKYRFKVTPWSFREGDGVVATGFDLGESAGLTALLLRFSEEKV